MRKKEKENLDNNGNKINRNYTPTGQFIDNRAESTALRKLKDNRNNTIQENLALQLRASSAQKIIQRVIVIDGVPIRNPSDIVLGLSAAGFTYDHDTDAKLMIKFDKSNESFASYEALGKAMEKARASELGGVVDRPSVANTPVAVTYQVVREGWEDEEAMHSHCWTYCGDKSKKTLVEAARKLGLPPPLFGHGSDSSKGGTGKDETLYGEFKAFMEMYFHKNGYQGKSLDQIAKRVLKG